jgi:predicted dehydrogenase
MRLGVIGCGLIGNKRASAARECGSKIVAVTDLNIELSASLAGRFHAQALPDWKAVVAAEIDAVFIATTHEALSAISLAAIGAGKHVLIEKPAGISAAEVTAVATAARRHDRVAKIGFNYRFHPAIAKAREIVDSGAIGPLMFVRARHGHGGRVGYDKEWRCQPEISGGGEGVDQGSHLIDLSRWFLGELTLDYAATPTYFWQIPVEDNCFVALRAAGGAMAWLHASWSEWKNVFSYEIYGRDGKLTIDGLGGSYGVERLTFHRMLPQMGPPETTIWEYPGPDGSWVAEHKEFAAAIAERRRPIGDISDACALWNLLEQIYRRT